MRMLQQNTVHLAAPVGVSVDANQTTQLPFARLQCILTESIGASLFSWQFPKISLQAMYQYWHYSDATNKIPPTKYLQASDVDFLGKAAKIRLCELKKVMTAIIDKKLLPKANILPLNT